MANKYEGIEHIVQVNTVVEMRCEHCDFWTGGSERFAQSLNHYIEAHGYRLLHVGSDTSTNLEDGSAWPFTVGILGK